jgi:CHAT domain-containing protein/tetratricopeptide (TPR) repeat protein
MDEYVKAEALLQQAVQIRRKTLRERDPQYAQSVDNLARLYCSMGEYAKAERLYLEALAVRKAAFGEEHRDYAASLHNLASLYLSIGKYAKAEPLLRQALEINKKVLGERHIDVALGLNNLAGAYYQMGEYAKAEPLFQQALQIERETVGEQHSLYATSLNHLAVLYHSTGEYAKAESLYQEALRIVGKMQGEQHLDNASILNNLAELYELVGERGRAADLAIRAARIKLRAATQIAMAMSEAQAINFVNERLGPPDVLLSVAGSQHAEELYEQVWARHGLVQQCVGRRQRQLQRIQAPEVRQKYQEYLATRQSLAALIVAPASPDLRQSEAALRRLKELGDKKERLEGQLAAELPEFRRQLENSRRGHKELLAQLRDGVVLIDLLSHHDFHEQVPNKLGRTGPGATSRYTAFLLSRNKPVSRIEIGPTGPIDQAITAWRADPDGATAASAPVLGRLLWEPIEKALPPGTQTVYLCPDGNLARLPWVALPGGSPGGVLLDDYALAVVPSGQFLLEQLTAASSTDDAGRLLAVGGVSYDAEPHHATAAAAALAMRSVAVGGGTMPWGPLSGSAREVAELAGNRPRVELIGAEASTSCVLEELPNARWAHFATHGFFADKQFRSAQQFLEVAFEEPTGLFGERRTVAGRNPLVLSGLVLAGANRPRQKDELGLPQGDGGILTAEAIAGLDLSKLELAVLSACETGLGDVAGGEGVFGLQRAFHLAGARNVVASLWKVDDRATAALMKFFYKNLWQKNLPPIEALRQAQLYLYHHPDEAADPATRGLGPAKPLPDGGARPPSRRTTPTRQWAGFVLSGVGD